MGVETATILMATVAAGAAVGKGVAQTAAASQKQEALMLESKEKQLESQQKMLSTYSLVEKTIDAQNAAISVRGVTANSPSFQAIERHTFDVGARRLKNLELEEDITQANFRTERENVQSKLYAELFGDVEEGAKNAASIYGSMPTGG